jgi:dienelactone hydrolase
MEQHINRVRGLVIVIMLATVAVAALVLINPSQAQGIDSRARSLLSTSDGVDFAIWPGERKRPAPTILALSSTIYDTSVVDYARDCGERLAKSGYLFASVDMPCHGRQQRDDEPQGLNGWSRRAARNDDFVAESNARLSAVVDHLIGTGQSEPERIAVCGSSRGGFLALHFAARDSRVRCAALFAPVTDLIALSEFRGLEENQLVQSLSLERHVKKLAGSPIWIMIGDQDGRVGTDRAIRLARLVTAASLEAKRAGRVELHVLPEPRGHSLPPESSIQAATWIIGQMN